MNTIIKLIITVLIITGFKINPYYYIQSEIDKNATGYIFCVNIDKDKDTFQFFQENYPEFIEVMLRLRKEGYLSNEDLINIDRYITQANTDLSIEVPYTDKDLVDFLYDNNIISESQYNRILELMEDD